MAIKQLSSPFLVSLKADGGPNSLGTVGVYKTGTSFATTAQIYDTQTKDNALTNPFTLSSAGTAEIWYDDVVDIEIRDAGGSLLPGELGQMLGVSSSISGGGGGSASNILANGSFETDSDSDGSPDNFSLSLNAGGIIAIDSTSGGQAHGKNSLKFTGAGSGAGTATSDNFDVLALSAVEVIFTYKSSAANTLNSLVVFWYKYDGSASATASTIAYSLGSGNPSSFTTYTRSIAVPVDAVIGKLVITGVSGSGTDKTGPTWFDDVQIKAKLDLEGIIYDSNGNKQVEFAATSSAINNLKITNAATGNNVSLDVSGEDVGVDIEGVTFKNGASTAPAGYTGDITGNADTVTTNADLTGSVISTGNAATVVKNADLTGMIESAGNATAYQAPVGGPAGRYEIVNIATPLITASTAFDDPMTFYTTHNQGQMSTIRLGVAFVVGDIGLTFRHYALAGTVYTRVLVNGVVTAEGTYSTTSATPVQETVYPSFVTMDTITIQSYCTSVTDGRIDQIVFAYNSTFVPFLMP